MHIQVVPGSSIGCPLSTSKTSSNLTVENLITEAIGNSRRMGLTNPYILASSLCGLIVESPGE